MLNVLTVDTATGVLCPNYAMRLRTVHTLIGKGDSLYRGRIFSCFSLVYNAVPQAG